MKKRQQEHPRDAAYLQLREFGKRARHHFKELGDDDLDRVLSATQDHARTGQNAKVLSILRKIEESKPRKAELKLEICGQIFCVNVASAMTDRQPDYLLKVRRALKALEKAKALFDDRLLVHVCEVMDESRGIRLEPLCWTDIRSRLGVMTRKDLGPIQSDEGGLVTLLHQMNPAFPPSVAALTRVSDARMGIDVLMDGLRGLEERLRHSQRGKRAPRQKDGHRVGLAVFLADVFEKHFGPTPGASRNHVWYTFLSATINCCEQRKKPLGIDGAYTLWLDAHKLRRSRQK
jgi:hypothetical protein